jgi:hypothetical protein
MSDLTFVGISIASFLNSVPNVVWSGIVGSFITVVGVLATNLGLSRRHREQLAHTADESTRKRSHDASESALERKMKLRRDIFIPAIEAVYFATSALATLSDPTIPRSVTLGKFVDAVGLIAKVNAVASAETVAAAGSLINHLMSMSLELGFKRNPIELAYSQVQANAQVVTRAVEEHWRWVQIQTSMLFEGPPPVEKFHFVGGQIALQQSQIDQWTGKRDTNSRKLQIAQLEFLKAMAEFQTSVSEASISTSIALRGELDILDDNPDTLRETLTKQSQIAKRTLQDSILRLEDQLGITQLSGSASLRLPGG